MASVSFRFTHNTLVLLYTATGCPSGIKQEEIERDAKVIGKVEVNVDLYSAFVMNTPLRRSGMAYI